MKNGNIKRTYKDSLFRMIFREKKELLSLYNAINGSDYSDPELLEVNTVEDALYMGIKNDISFLISDYLNLYEVQSTWNPNIHCEESSIFHSYIKAMLQNTNGICMAAACLRFRCRNTLYFSMEQKKSESVWRFVFQMRFPDMAVMHRLSNASRHI